MDFRKEGPFKGPSFIDTQSSGGYLQATLFWAIFLLYLIFLCPVVYNGDSPLLSASAFALGPAHPPGYPLYVMLGKAVTLLPLGSVAFRINLLSALAGALASLLVFKSVRELTADDASSVFAALIAAFAPLAWAESTKAEVYTLNAALVMAIFYFGMRFLKEGADRRPLFVMSFVLGLGMGNHHTIGFMALPLGLAILLRARQPRTIFYCLLFFSAGMGVYALSYIRSLRYAADAALFEYSEAGSFKGFISTFLREEYHPTLEAVAAPARDPLSFLRGPFNAVRYLIYGNLGTFGLLAFFSLSLIPKRKAEMSFALTALASYAVLLGAMVYAFRAPEAESLFLLDPYLLPALYITATLAGCGAFFIKEIVAVKIPSARRPVALALLLAPLVFALPDALKNTDLSRYYLAEDYSEDLLESLPPESVLITGSDASYFPLAYKNFVEKKREDVLLIHGDSGGLMVQATPRWRYSILFPDLPVEGPFSVLDAKYLDGKTLYAFEPAFLPDGVKNFFMALPYYHAFRLVPAVEDVTDDPNFKRAFDVFVYERNIKERSYDPYSAELKMSMFIPLSHFAYLTKTQGDLKLSQRYYEDALKLMTPKGVAHYVRYLETAGRKDEAEAFLDALAPYADKNPGVRELEEEIRMRFL